MDYQALLDTSIRECEEISNDLQQLNQRHELLRFDAEGKSDEEKDLLLKNLIQCFGPEGDYGNNITDEILYMTFESLRFALVAAIIIEKARLGHFKPL